MIFNPYALFEVLKVRDLRLEPVQRYRYYEDIRKDSKESNPHKKLRTLLFSLIFYNTSPLEAITSLYQKNDFFFERFNVPFPSLSLSTYTKP